MDVVFLRQAYRRTRKVGAVGVDGQTAYAYSQNLEVNLASCWTTLSPAPTMPRRCGGSIFPKKAVVHPGPAAIQRWKIGYCNERWLGFFVPFMSKIFWSAPLVTARDATCTWHRRHCAITSCGQGAVWVRGGHPRLLQSCILILLSIPDVGVGITELCHV
jgi:hypothetical protein